MKIKISHFNKGDKYINKMFFVGYFHINTTLSSLFILSKYLNPFLFQKGFVAVDTNTYHRIEYKLENIQGSRK